VARVVAGPKLRADRRASIRIAIATIHTYSATYPDCQEQIVNRLAWCRPRVRVGDWRDRNASAARTPHSMTSSARCSIDCGTLSPSAFAGSLGLGTQLGQQLEPLGHQPAGDVSDPP
jgi:hypothetical protein